MGLDMYLHAEKYVSSDRLFAEDDPLNFEGLLKAFGDGGMSEAVKAVRYPSAYVTFTVAYWRKAHEIHAWFVRECQDGVDECQRTYVSREKLRELRETCLRVLASRSVDVAKELLAPKGGFGRTDLGESDEWYWQNVESTVEQLDRAIGLPDRWSLYYRSSW